MNDRMRSKEVMNVMQSYDEDLYDMHRYILCLLSCIVKRFVWACIQLRGKIGSVEFVYMLFRGTCNENV